MKYGQLIAGLLAGAAIVTLADGSVGAGVNGGVDREEVAAIVREVIAKEPKLIIDAVMKYQQDQHAQATQSANEALKDQALQKAIYEDENSAFIGPKDAKKVVVEYFDYDCPACKMMYKGIDQLAKEHKDVKVIFKEFPIFGPTSDNNAKLGFAIWHYYPEKYFKFYSKLMNTPGHGDAKNPPKFVQELGMDLKKLQAYAATPEVEQMLKDTRAQAEKLNIGGTPALIIDGQVIPSAISYQELVSRLGLSGSEGSEQPEAEKAKDAE